MILVAGAAAMMLLASCGGDSVAATTAAPQTTTAADPPGSTAGTTQATDTPEVEVEICEDIVTGIEIGSSIDGMLEVGDTFVEDQFFCVDVAAGATTLTIELTGATADLDLFVGYPDMATLQGGGVSFWFSDNRGLGDEIVVIEPGRFRNALGIFEQADHVTPGSYYIEVSANGGRDPSPFTLGVSVPQAPSGDAGSG